MIGGQHTGAIHPSPRRQIWLLAVAYGLTIANLYYCQPLLPQMAQSYEAGSWVGNLTAVGQLGYALGLVLVVPLGDIVRRRPLICLLLCLEAAALAMTSTAPMVGVLLAAGMVIGLASASVVNILVPYAAALAADDERGRMVATMYSGGQVGILLSRTVAGLTAEIVGWRPVFLAAAVVTLTLAAVLARSMPPSPPEMAIDYKTQLKATINLAVSEPVLRRRSLIGACVFASFGAFWATIAFLLAGRPYHYGEAQIGLFALVGATGALAAKASGRAADRGWQRSTTGVLLIVGLASFGAIWAGGQNLAWLIVGLLAMGAAISGTHLLNMSVVYSLTRSARARIATVYMTCYTLGGVAGAAAGTAAYRFGGWDALSAVGAICMAAGLLTWIHDWRVAEVPEPPGPGTR